MGVEILAVGEAVAAVTPQHLQGKTRWGMQQHWLSQGRKQPWCYLGYGSSPCLKRLMREGLTSG